MTVTIRTSLVTGIDTEEESENEEVQDKIQDEIQEEIKVYVTVTWTSEPEYDMNLEGEYIFTPVIEEYNLADDVLLPEIKVMVKKAILMKNMAAVAMAESLGIWIGDVEVTSENASDVMRTVRYLIMHPPIPSPFRVHILPPQVFKISRLVWKHSTYQPAFFRREFKHRSGR